jgi:hypothetical protein
MYLGMILDTVIIGVNNPAIDWVVYADVIGKSVR